MELLEDVAKRRGLAYSVGHGEAQTHRLSGPVIGVLTEDHHPHVRERRQLKGREHAVGGGIEPASGAHLLDEERTELLHRR